MIKTCLVFPSQRFPPLRFVILNTAPAVCRLNPRMWLRNFSSPRGHAASKAYQGNHKTVGVPQDGEAHMEDF